MSLDLATEQQVALAAVRRACTVTSLVFNKLVNGETLVKGDKSPVTGASFCLLHPSPLMCAQLWGLIHVLMV